MVKVSDRTVAFELVVRDVFDDGVLQSWRIVTVSHNARYVAFPEPSGEPREMTITRQRIALHDAENVKQFIRPPLIMRTEARNIFWHAQGRDSEGQNAVKTRTDRVIINDSISLSH